MIGKIVQNYRIINKIGEGGMGIVYLAENTMIKRKAAIKFLNPVFVQNEIIKKKFINEAQTLAELNHPNIVIFYDFGTFENNFFFLMEYIEGISLDKIISSDRVSLDENLIKNIFYGILNGLSYAHKKSVIHRDIKPSNIIISKDGTTKILDFGIAKMLNANSQQTGVRMGSIYYMSPEQVLNKDTDLRTDIYSLGITLFEVLTKNILYKDITSDFLIYQKIVNEDIPSPRSINPSISEYFNSIVLKATEKNPDDRFQTCEEFSLALNNKSFKYQRKSSGILHFTRPKEKADIITEGVSIKEKEDKEIDFKPEKPIQPDIDKTKVFKPDKQTPPVKIENPYKNKPDISIPKVEEETKKRNFIPYSAIIIVTFSILLVIFIFIFISSGGKEEEDKISNKDTITRNLKDTIKKEIPETPKTTVDKTDDEIKKDDNKINKDKKITQKKTTRQTENKVNQWNTKKEPETKTNNNKTKPRVRFD